MRSEASRIFRSAHQRMTFTAQTGKGADLFSDCLLALDARTGKYLWHFQTTHHDLWDYDLATGPKLLTIQHDGKPVDVIVEATKNGSVWILDRTNGKPIWPVEERPVPQSDVPGEQSWPTQPFPTHVPVYTRQKFTADMVNPYISDPKERRGDQEGGRGCPWRRYLYASFAWHHDGDAGQ